MTDTQGVASLFFKDIEPAEMISVSKKLWRPSANAISVLNRRVSTRIIELISLRHLQHPSDREQKTKH